MKLKGIIMLITALLFNVVVGSAIGFAVGISPALVVAGGVLLSLAVKPLSGVLPMAIVINSAYNGEVLEKLLTRATTKNELVERGLIKLVPEISDKYYIPRMRTGKMLQKRKEQPTDEDGKGNFNIDERLLKPQEFMAFTTFNPRSFEKFWRPWQPKGELVFAELPVEAQNKLLEAMANAVDFELGGHFINGIFGDDDDHLFDGILTRMLSDKDVINVPVGTAVKMVDKLTAIRKAIPKTMRNNPGLRLLMSIADADKYDDELTRQTSKGKDFTDKNPERFKGIAIEPLAQWPDGLIVATITGMDDDTNLWAGCNLVDDYNVIQIAKLTNAGERYFFKMLMKADTNTAWGEEVVMMDAREKTTVSVAGGAVVYSAYVAELSHEPASDGEIVSLTGTPELGARLVVTNTSAANKMVVAGIDIEKSTTAILAWSGTAWFKA